MAHGNAAEAHSSDRTGLADGEGRQSRCIDRSLAPGEIGGELASSCNKARTRSEVSRVELCHDLDRPLHSLQRFPELTPDRFVQHLVSPSPELPSSRGRAQVCEGR